MWISVIIERLPHQILQDVCCSQYVLQQSSALRADFNSAQRLTHSSCCFVFRAGDEVVTVKTPAFAESVSEGDVRWEKGWYESTYYKLNNVSTSKVLAPHVLLPTSQTLKCVFFHCFSRGRLGDRRWSGVWNWNWQGMNEQDQQPENPVFHEQKKEKIL